MHKHLLAATALLGLALAAPAFAESSPEAYLQTAKQAVMAHQSGNAMMALDRAEAAMLEREPAASNAHEPSSSLVIRQIARARQAAMMKQWSEAATSIDEALKHPSVELSEQTKQQ